jgi:hypothetical protein
MSNERIDVTQFEGMTEGEWLYYEYRTSIHNFLYGGLLIPHYFHKHEMGPYKKVISSRLDNKRRKRPLWPTKADLKAMAAAPELIAELKRCYERIDALEKVVAGTAHCLECLSDDGCYPPCSKYIEY